MDIGIMIIMGSKYLANQKNAACAHHPVKMMVPHDGGPAVDGDDDCDPRSSTDLARAWEAILLCAAGGKYFNWFH